MAANDGVAGTRIVLANSEVATDAVHSVSVALEVDLPDMATIVLNNTGEYGYSHNTAHGDTVEVKIGPTDGDVTSVFKGEVVGIEPKWQDNGESSVTIRAFNKLHRLTRGKKSRTFTGMTDKDIISKIATEYGLRPDIKGDVNIKFDHVYQHDQSDFRFVLVRAARINYEVLCDNTLLTFRKRDVSVDSGIELKWKEGLESFGARLSTAGQVQEVNVRAWDPEKHTEIVGKATAPQTSLGGEDGWAAAQKFGKAMWYDVDIPVTTVEAADAIAKAKLEELRMNFITGEGQAKGDPRLKAGITVKITTGDQRFDGKYYITGVSHNYSHKAKGSTGGFRSTFKVCRNADQ
jgi:phage protein D